VQIAKQVDQQTAEYWVEQGDKNAEYALSVMPWLRFAFPSSPDTAELAEHVFAFAETEGDWPHYIVVDNLSDVAFEGDEFGEMRRNMEDLAALARKTKSAVHVLHHANGEYETGTETIPMRGINGKVSKKPTGILTMNNGATPGDLWLSVVKNRFGPADPAGFRFRAGLNVNYETMQLRDKNHG
jgi:hypothetical protein